MSIAIRNAEPEEAEVLAEIEAVCWPVALAADAERQGQRIAAFREGQWVADQRGRLVGFATAQRVTEAFLFNGPATYDRLTDGGSFRRSHCPEGEVYQLVSVSVLPEARGLRLGRRLVDRQIAFARSLPGVKRILGFTRPAGFATHPEADIEAYLALTKPNGQCADPVLEFHLGSGATLVSVHPGYRPEDDEACGYGVMIEYPV